MAENLLDDKEQAKKQPITAQNTLEAEKVDASKVTRLSESVINNYLITTSGRKTVYAHVYDDNKVAFTEKDSKLVAKDTNITVIKNMVDVAESKGWDNITITGNKEFKRAAWLEAKAKGLDVNGYTPTEIDLAKLEKKLSKANAIVHEPEKETPKENNLDNKEPSSVLPIASIEAKQLREKELTTAFSTLSKDDAIDKYPELEKVYDIEPSAVAFYRAQGGNQAQESAFQATATNKAIKDIAAGKPIPEFDIRSYKVPEPTNGKAVDFSPEL